MHSEMFPRNCIIVYDRHGKIADYALYFNSMKCRLAHSRLLRRESNGFRYLHREDGWYQGIESTRAPIEVIQSYIFDFTFYMLSKEQLRQKASKNLPYEVLNEAADYEFHYMRNTRGIRGQAFKRKYLWSFRDFFPSG